jgi:hypothetical protein
MRNSARWTIPPPTHSCRPAGCPASIGAARAACPRIDSRRGAARPWHKGALSGTNGSCTLVSAYTKPLPTLSLSKTVAVMFLIGEPLTRSTESPMIAPTSTVRTAWESEALVPDMSAQRLCDPLQ